MAVLDQERASRIRQLLKWHPRGLTISEITRQLKMNRNLAAKNLDMLLIAGHVEMQLVGAAKVYFLAKSVPVLSMLEFSSDLVIMIDQDRKILHINEPALLLFAESRENVIGRNVGEVVGPVLPGLSFERDVGETSEKNAITNASGRIQGETRHFRIKKLPTAFEDGTQGLTLMMEDVTVQKTNHEQLAISEARYRGIVNSSGEAIIGTDPEGRITSWNPAAEHLYGYPVTEAEGKYLRMLAGPANQGELDDLFRGIAEGNCILRKDVKMVRKDGDSIDTLVTICPIRGENVAIAGASLIIRDVTREKLEQYMRQREDLHREDVMDLKVGFYRSTGDPHGRFVWGNTALLDILGFPTIEDLQNVRVIDLFSAPNARIELLDELHRSGFVKNRILNLTKKDGKPITVSVTALAECKDKDQLVFINGIVQDITDYVTEAR
jgi:PAS domain S-box-containing protein